MAVFDPTGRLKTTAIDPERIPDDAWELESVSSDGMRRTYTYFDIPSGLYFRKVENLAEEAMLLLNKARREEADKRRWKDGMDMAASVPLNVYFREIAKYRQKGDHDHMKWWLNRPDNEKYRTKRGRI